MTAKKRRLPVVAYLGGVPEARCPDCNARYIAGELRHEDSCPLQNSVEQVCAEDAAWFVANPTETMRTRPITHAEQQQLLHTDPAAGAATHVIVANFAWGRTRGFIRGEDVHGIMLDFDGAA